MPPEREEIKTLHTKSPERIIREEVKEIWITQNPNRSIDDFNFKPEGQKWRGEKESLLKDFSNRWDVERTKIPVLTQMDQTVKASLRPVTDNKANATYTTLNERFGDSEVNHFPHAKWALPSDAESNWKELVKSTNEQVQRNANNLATVVKTTKSVAGDEVFRKAKEDAIARRDPKVDVGKVADQARTDWEASELKTALDGVEKTLADWDKLLAENALPDKQKLQALADKCDGSFFQFYREHVPVYDTDGKAPFLKFQLLATMRSLSEKVASQFAARLGNPSFSAAYGLITEVPVSGKYENIKVKAGDLGKQWGAPDETGFRKERDKFMADIWTSDKNVAHPALNAEIAKTKGLDSALTEWRKAHDAIGSGDPRALSKLYSATAELSVQFKNYKQAIDSVLKDNPSSTVQNIRTGYQETLDGFIANITIGILVGKNLG